MESDWIRIDEAMLLTGRGFDTLEAWVLGKRSPDGTRQTPLVPLKVIDGLPHWHRPSLLEACEKHPYPRSKKCLIIRAMEELQRPSGGESLDAIADKLFSTPEGRAAIIRRIQGVA